MRVFFIGTVEFSFHVLKQLVTLSEVEVVGVATKAGSSVNADYADLRPLCEEYNIGYKLVKDINHENNIQYIRDCRPDVIYCFGWSNLIKEALLNVAPMGVIGFHPAALPYNRGRHPIIWALALGLKSTASTFFFMDTGADTGDILSQQPIRIEEEDDAASLYEKITQTALGQVATFSRELSEGSYQRLPQKKEEGNNWRKRGAADGKIDFRMNSGTICNLVRALTKPYVGAHVEVDGRFVTVWKARPDAAAEENYEPGKVLDVKGREIKVKTADGAVWLVSHEFLELPFIGTYL